MTSPRGQSATSRRSLSGGRFWREARKAPVSAWFGATVVIVYALLAVAAPIVAPYGEAEIVSQSSFEPWSAQHLLGTDQLGRDMLSRLIYAGRNTIFISLITTCLAFVVGGGLGILAALLRGWPDELLSRLVDVLMAIPALIFALIILTIVGSSIPNLILIIALLDATRVFRLSRAVALNVTTMEYVEIARARGESLVWIIVREILPNIAPTLIAEFGLRFCAVFLTISALSFLGLGIQPPTADWGSMVRDNASLLIYGDITPLIPAAAIALLTVGINFLMDHFIHRTSGLRDEY